MDVWTCTIPGTPRTKNRKIAVVSKRGKIHTFNPENIVAAENNIRAICMMNRPPKLFRGCLARHVIFVFKIPKSRSKELTPGDWCERKWDIGNGLKLLEDALRGIVYEDDSQIVTGIVSKSWGDIAETRVMITEADDPLPF